MALIFKAAAAAIAVSLPIFKCLAVSVITKFSADLCKDSGQTALSSTVEFAGCVCAAMVVMPLIVNMINLVGTMV